MIDGNLMSAVRKWRICSYQFEETYQTSDFGRQTS